MLQLPRLVRTLLALLAVAGLALAGADDEIVKEFRRYFRKFKDTPSRVEAVLALKGTESTTVVDALLPVLSDDAEEVVDAAVQVLGAFRERPPIDAVFTSLADEKKEERRLGLLRAIAVGSYSGDPEALFECLSDRSWQVRRRAAQAVAARGGEHAEERLAPLCADDEPAVRCAALDGLTLLRSRAVVEPGIAALQDEVWQVRSSAITALGVVRDKRSIEPLIARMEVEEGRLGADIGAALGEITGRDFRDRTDLWRQFWENVRERGYEIPTDAEMARLREKQAESAARYKPGKGTSYHGIETPSRKILFVIDVSGSMENHVVEKDRFADGDYPSFSRIDIVKTELRRTIEGLEGYVEFNILSFATEVDRWKKDLVSANVLNKKSADTWVSRLEAIGGNSKEELAAAGLVGSANLGAGKTNTYGVLMAALEVAGRGARDKHYGVAVDTIFFLSDGRPTHGELVDPDDILREVREANELRKVVIHTIAIGEFQKDFMRRLARENAGVFVDLGR